MSFSGKGKGRLSDLPSEFEQDFSSNVRVSSSREGTGRYRNQGPEEDRPVSPARSTRSNESSVSQRRPVGRKRERKFDDAKVVMPAHRPHEKGSSSGEMKQIFVTNHLRVTVDDQVLHQYHVDFEPSVEQRAKKRTLLFAHKEKWAASEGGGAIFDGMMLYTKTKIEGDGEGGEIELTSVDEKDPQGGEYIVRIKDVNKQMIMGKDREEPMPVYNVLLRRSILGKNGMGLVQIGRDHFFPNPGPGDSVPEYKLLLLPGFRTAINMHDGGITLTVQSIYRTLREESTLDWLRNFERGRGSNRRGGGGGDWQQGARLELKGLQVLTRYNNKKYRIDDVRFDMSPSSKFVLQTGAEVSFQEYVETHYKNQGIKLSTTNQPMIESRVRIRGRAENTVFLVPELCYLTGLTDAMRADHRLMRSFDEKTRMAPSTRMEKLHGFANEMAHNEKIQEDLRDWGVNIASQPLNVEGFVLSREAVRITPQLKEAERTTDWGKAVCNSSLVYSKPLTKWAVIFEQENRDDGEIIYNIMAEAGRPMQLRVEEPMYLPIETSSPDDYSGAIEYVASEKPQVVIIVVPDMNSERFTRIKQQCMVDTPVPHQVLLHMTLSKRNITTIAKKILMQVAAKCGFQLWGISRTFDEPTMIVGVDVCHRAGLRGQSVLGFCATIDETFTQYFSKCTYMPTGQNMASTLTGCFSDALDAFKQFQHTYPKRIILYRDGVSDGMLNAVVEFEIPQILKAIEDRKLDVLLYFIIVKRGINTRFFMKTAEGYLNPPSGSVVDQVITHRAWWDFFLVSQHAPKEGTVSPTHYVVAWSPSEPDLSPRDLQHFTYQLTHLYFNWTGPIRVPAPNQYARKLAYMVGEKVRKVPDNRLSKQLYYL